MTKFNHMVVYSTLHHMTFLENSIIARGYLTATCHFMYNTHIMGAYFLSNSFVNRQKIHFLFTLLVCLLFDDLWLF